MNEHGETEEILKHGEEAIDLCSRWRCYGQGQSNELGRGLLGHVMAEAVIELSKDAFDLTGHGRR